MNHLGWYVLGEHVPIGIQTYNSSGLHAVPDSAPTFKTVKNATGTLIETGVAIPIIGKGALTGQFAYRLPLTSAYSSGIWHVFYSWSIGGFTGQEFDTFEVHSGGDSRGTPISMTYYDLRGIDHLVYQTDMGNIIAGTSPRL
jgi:hypothetical protein